jgi:hypothetical protein
MVNVCRNLNQIRKYANAQVFTNTEGEMQTYILSDASDEDDGITQQAVDEETQEQTASVEKTSNGEIGEVHEPEANEGDLARQEDEETVALPGLAEDVEEPEVGDGDEGEAEVEEGETEDVAED